MDELAQKVGYLGRSAISKVENGERLISHEMLIKYSQIFGVSPSFLLFGDTDKEKALCGKKTSFPILEKVSNDEMIFAEEEHSTTADIDADFCFSARDNSMTGARINCGDIVFIKADKNIQNGDIVAVAINGDYTLKYWYYYPDNKRLVLNSANQNCEPLIYIGSEIKNVVCLGKATHFIGTLRGNK